MYISLLIKLISFLFLIAITGDFNVKYTSCEILEYVYFGNSKDTSFKVLFFSLALINASPFPQAQGIPSSLPDVSKNGYHNLNQIMDVFKNHHLNSGEIQSIFRIADLDNDNKISDLEWHHFHDLFVRPFEFIASDGDYLIDEVNIR